MTVVTFWLCDRCGANGSFQHEKTASVMAVLYKIEDAHANIAPSDCEFNIYKVRAGLKPIPAPVETR
jgi:hypothetical protein